MPHPVPIIIGTTVAVVTTGYAFKKASVPYPEAMLTCQFVYDPHLAPLIEDLIAQHRARRGYVPVGVPTSPEKGAGPEKAGAEPGVRDYGRSTNVRARQECGGALRRRRAAEAYELDEARLGDGHNDHPVSENMHSYEPRVRRKPVPRDSGAGGAQSPRPGTAAGRASPGVPAPPPLISLEDRDVPPSLRRPHSPVVQPPSPESTLSGISAVPSPAGSAAVLIDLPSLSRPDSVVSSHLSSRASPAATSVGLPDDIDIVSISGTTTSFVDAESYTPRTLSPVPSGVASGASSRPLSPPVALGASALALAASDLTFPAPSTAMSTNLLGSDVTFPAPNAAHAHIAPPLTTRQSQTSASYDDSSAVSVSSWAEEDWHQTDSEWGVGHTDSEWDAMSDAQ